MPDPAIAGVFRKPFAEQAEFFRRKIDLPTEYWDDIRGAQHDHAFVVAGAMKADLIADLRAAVQRAIDEGKTLAWFQGEFERIVERRGWTGWRGEGSAAGVAWRTGVIYTTNLRVAHAAGRWAQMTDPDVMAARPYWRYVHRSTENPRLSHKAWHGTVLPANDPWFRTHYTPNGFGCQCIVETINEREMQRLGKSGPDARPPEQLEPFVVPSTGEIVQLPRGVAYGWDYAPGKSAAEAAIAARRQRLESMDTAVAALNVGALVASEIFGRFFVGAIGGEFPVAVIGAADRAAIGAESSVVLLSQESLAAHVAKHPEISIADYRRIQAIIDRGEVYQQGEARLVYLTVGKDRYRAALKRTADGKKNYFLTLFKNETGARPKPNTRLR